MKTLAIAVLAATLIIPNAALAAGDLSRADVIEVVMELGSNDGKMFLSPDHFVFETGQAYKWVLTNVDDIKHELAIGPMFEKIFTRKIQAFDLNGNLVTEVKGAIYEVEIGAGQTVEWFFVPVQTLELGDIACDIPGHKEAGMFGTVTIN